MDQELKRVVQDLISDRLRPVSIQAVATTTAINYATLRAWIQDPARRMADPAALARVAEYVEAVTGKRVAVTVMDADAGKEEA